MVSQMTVLAVGGILYLATPYGSILALDGDNGKTAGGGYLGSCATTSALVAFA